MGEVVARAALLLVALGATAGCRRHRAHSNSPCAARLSAARTDAREGYLERAIFALDAKICPSHAAAVVSWAAEGRSDDGRGETDYLAEASAASARGDVRAARVLYTRAIDALHRAGGDWDFGGTVSTAHARSSLSFSSYNAWFLDEANSTLTAWSPDARQPFAVNAEIPTAGAITPRGRVVYVTPHGLFAWTRSSGGPVALGIGDPIPNAFPSGAALDVANHDDLLAWASVIHRPSARTVATLDVRPLSVAWSSDGRHLRAATNVRFAEYDLSSTYRLGVSPVRSVMIPGEPLRDVAVAHVGRELVTHDNGGIHRYRITDEKMELIASSPIPTRPETHSEWGRPEQLVLSPSDRWLLVRGHGGGRVYSMTDLRLCGDPHDNNEPTGFMQYRGREWVVVAPKQTDGATWTLFALPEQAEGCDNPRIRVDLTRLVRGEHGIDALQRVTHAPCDATEFACPPNRMRMTIDLLWSTRADADAWFASHLTCRSGSRQVPTPACLLHYAR